MLHMLHVEANGIGLQYEERGSGPPLLLIMGFGAPPPSGATPL